jgi:hypothetical protein
LFDSGIPWGFVKAGIVLSPAVLFVVSILSFVTVIFVLDTMSRAQAMFGPPSAPSSPIATSTKVSVDNSHNRLLNAAAAHGSGKIEISNHKFEMNELVGLFIGNRAQRLYELTVMLYLVGALWSYTSVFASSLASHVGIPFINDGQTCLPYSDSSSGCTQLYLFYAAIFAVIVVPLTCMDLTEQKPLQIALSCLRFVAVAVMVSTTIAAIWSYPNPDLQKQPDYPTQAPFYADVSQATWSNLGRLFPITVYSQIFHHSIPGLTQPVADKSKLRQIYGGVMATTFSLYTMLGVTLALYYGSSIEQACTLNWASYSAGKSPAPGWAVFISYLVVLFPPLDVISAFPINALTLGNNLLVAVVPDLERRSVCSVKTAFRLLAAIPPLIGACVLKDLKTVLSYTGCTGIILAFLFPALLQLYSLQRSRDVYGPSADSTPYSFRLFNNKVFIYSFCVFSVAVFCLAVVLVALE